MERRIKHCCRLDAIDQGEVQPYSINGTYGYDLGPWFGCEVDGWGCDSSEIRGFAYRFVYGTGYGVGCGFTDFAELTDMFNSKLILLVGVCDITQDSFASFGYYLRLAREKGIPIISIDPRYTETGEVLADQWIPIRMATDTALGLAIANVMFKQNLYDTDYVSKFVEPTGLQKWKDYVLGNTAGPDGAIDRNEAWAATITGIPAATITALAQSYAKTQSQLIWYAETRLATNNLKERIQQESSVTSKRWLDTQGLRAEARQT